MTEQPFDPIAFRREEIAQYDANISLYTNMVAALPSDWPEHLLGFKSSTEKHIDIAKVENMNDVELLSDLWAHDDAQAAIRSEIVEKRKAEAILAALLIG
jgi:hypothetical protein